LLFISAVLWFRRKKTGLKPFSESTALVVEGPYRFTRNPIYAGFTLMLIGVALALGAVSSLIAVPLYVAIIHFRFILPEEAHMERAFGEEYLALKRRVRRWL
jgi:protein-S-isoprenylcysteine O-methyltransferase Ste14